MSPFIEAFLAKYGAVVVGVGIGTAAKYRLNMGEGRVVTRKEVLADLLLVPFVIMLAAYVGTKLSADPHLMAIIASFMSLSADRLIRMLRERFLQRVDQEVAGRASQLLGVARETVQAEISSNAIINDTLAGTAPEEYKSLKPRKGPQ